AAARLRVAWRVAGHPQHVDEVAHVDQPKAECAGRRGHGERVPDVAVGEHGQLVGGTGNGAGHNARARQRQAGQSNAGAWRFILYNRWRWLYSRWFASDRKSVV